ncbi:CPBP family intramembrane glutamic endopeptidase [Butyrivibrio sp. WCD3002]|uniref:CPBP family intramembrane glutamic endopeptidase n=1 Tax=Butyrivibrio sp. WCD3002 TaxID=1280676 RepID=UPI000402B82F|nr:CPBP family intramembrane glutamic endopeptidase [Butyrivibrio sp. WCD3002]
MLFSLSDILWKGQDKWILSSEYTVPGYVPNACPMEINRLSQLRGRAYENMCAIATCNYPANHPLSMTRKHTILDHPIIGYFVLFIFVMLFSSIGASLIDNPLSNFIPGYAKEMIGFGTTVKNASGIGAAIGVIIAAIIFAFWFRPDLKNFLSWKGFRWGIQVAYCIGVGAVFGAVYLRTANLWVVMIAHFTLDFVGLINSYYTANGGASTQLLISDWTNLVASAIGIVTALILLSPKHYPEIMELWKEKWSQ